jgi:hypothetical protein
VRLNSTPKDNQVLFGIAPVLSKLKLACKPIRVWWEANIRLITQDMPADKGSTNSALTQEDMPA